MPIVALPQSTVRAIGSTSVISDPCSVVKELIDNALDASASSLLVEISQNTVDVIQIRDNGHGIPTEDHPCVCKHTFTSKIQTLDDLKNVGGTSFGFRGEALASVAEMSGGVNITTHVASEVTGNCLKYGRGGELTDSQRTSHPVGTTVRITDFLKHIPVRRQTAVKAATKCLTKIRKLIQAYAFAQPSRRFSLKVLKAKNESNNWIYAPGTDATLPDAAMKIVGIDVASCCVMKQFSSQPTPGSGTDSDENGYKLIAFLPAADTGISSVNNMGQFLSVDGRPLSTTRGIGQDVAKLFKSYMRASRSKNENTKAITDPFLCLQLECPRGAYDVNIEPGKDDVLFEDREVVMSLVESLFRDHYVPLTEALKTSPVKGQKAASNGSQMDTGFELLMARRRPDESSLQPHTAEDNPEYFALASPLSQAPTRSVGPSSPQDPFCDGPHNGPDHREGATGNRDSRFVNPWSISRINASFQTSQRRPVPQSGSSQGMSRDTPRVVIRQDFSPPSDHHPTPPSPEVPSLPASRLTPVSPIARQRRLIASQGSPSETTSTPSSLRKAARNRDRERYGNGALDTWFQRTTQVSLGQSSVESPLEQEDIVPTLSQLAQQRFQSQPQDSASNPAVDAGTHEASNARPDKEPSHASPDDDPSRNERQEGSMDSGRGFPVLEKWAASLHEGFYPDSQSNLERALDFERRKKEANKRHRTRSGPRERQSNPRLGPSAGPSPHHNRYLAAKAALTAGQSRSIEQPTGPSLSPHDPRAYLMRHQSDQRPSESSKVGTKLQRLRTSRLPFEQTPDGYDIHDVRLPLVAKMPLISTLSSMTALHDAYTRCGDDADSFSAFDRESLVPFWNRQLNAIINQQYKTKDDSRSPEWRVDLSAIVTRHVNEFHEK